MKNQKTFLTSTAMVAALNSITADACVDSYEYQIADAYCETINLTYGPNSCSYYVSFEPDIGFGGQQYGRFYRLIVVESQPSPRTFVQFYCYQPFFQ